MRGLYYTRSRDITHNPSAENQMDKRLENDTDVGLDRDLQKWPLRWSSWGFKLQGFGVQGSWDMGLKGFWDVGFRVYRGLGFGASVSGFGVSV